MPRKSMVMLPVLLLCGAAARQDAGSASARGSGVDEIARATEFSDKQGDWACVSRATVAFVEARKAGQIESFRKLAASSNPAARLYGLCGVARLASSEAGTLRARLAKSKDSVTVTHGCIAEQITMEMAINGWSRQPWPDRSKGSPFDFICSRLDDLSPSKYRLCQ